MRSSNRYRLSRRCPELSTSGPYLIGCRVESVESAKLKDAQL